MSSVYYTLLSSYSCRRTAEYHCPESISLKKFTGHTEALISIGAANIATLWIMPIYYVAGLIIFMSALIAIKRTTGVITYRALFLINIS
jgi:hypothetical protein